MSSQTIHRLIPVIIAIPVLAAYFLFQGMGRFSFKDLFLLRPIGGQVASVRYPERQVPNLLTDTQPRVKATAAAVYDLETRAQLWGRQTDKAVPIASLTKLMSALVFLDHNPGWQSRYEVVKADHRAGATDNLHPGDSVTIRELFRTALIASDNSAVIGLVRVSGLSEKDFVREMNEKARLLRLKQSVFVDPTGLKTANRSTAGNLGRLAGIALNDPDIREALARPSYAFTTAAGAEKKIEATNELLGKPLPSGIALVGGKTGHLDEAGYCFVGWFVKDGHEVVTVILGAESVEARFAETEKMVEWAYKNYRWP